MDNLWIHVIFPICVMLVLVLVFVCGIISESNPCFADHLFIEHDFCPKCGSQLRELPVTCPGCGFSDKTDFGFCPECGGVLVG